MHLNLSTKSIRFSFFIKIMLGTLSNQTQLIFTGFPRKFILNPMQHFKEEGFSVLFCPNLFLFLFLFFFISLLPSAEAKHRANIFTTLSLNSFSSICHSTTRRVRNALPHCMVCAHSTSRNSLLLGVAASSQDCETG